MRVRVMHIRKGFFMITVSGKGTFEEKQRCCGCGACAELCPAGCIRMEADAEGFLYPCLDAARCIGCGLCEKHCPVSAAGADAPFPQEGYIVQILDEEVRRQSTAGGAFTAIARYVLQQGGVVFGAAYTEGFRVRHMGVDREEDLWRFRNSKYVQSETGQAFAEAGHYLRQGRYVCFSGTPCQIEGLLNYLEGKYGGGRQGLRTGQSGEAEKGTPAYKGGILDRLVTVDVVCHAVPSPLVFEKYVRMQKKRFGDRMDTILFREKHYGYKYSTMTVRDGEGKDLYAHGIDTDPMLRAFFSDVCDRPSCYACRFKKRYRRSDFTIWDCYTVYQFEPRMDDDRGTTRVLVHSDKGREVFVQIRQSLRWSAVDPDALTDGVREMFRSVEVSPRREAFMEDAAVLGGRTLFQKWFPETWKVRAERTARSALVRTGLYTGVKKMLFRLRSVKK